MAGLTLLTTRDARAQQPTEADSAAVFALAVEEIVAADSMSQAPDSARPVRLANVSRSAWAASAVARLRTLERPGTGPEELSVTGPEFAGDTARVYESRLRCYASGFMGGTQTEYVFVRAGAGWELAPADGFSNVDGICLRRPTKR